MIPQRVREAALRVKPDAHTAAIFVARQLRSKVVGKADHNRKAAIVQKVRAVALHVLDQVAVVQVVVLAK